MLDIDQESLSRFEMLLPFFVNGTLNKEDASFMDAFLAQHPHMEKSVHFERYLISALREPLPERRDDAGLNAVLNKWQKNAEKKPSVTEWLHGIMQDWGLTPAFGVAAILVVVQSMMLLSYQHPSILPTSIDQKFRSMTGSANALQLFKLSIAANAEYAQVIQLIQDNGCHIQDGPTASGALFIACPYSAERLQKLQLSPLVDDVILESSQQ